MFRLKDNVDAILKFSIRPIYPICPIYPTWVLFLIPVMCGSRSGDGGACSKIAWVLILIPVMCGSRLYHNICLPNGMGINFNTRDVWASLAEVKGSSAMMWVLF